MVSKEPLSTSHASYIRERLLAGYVNIWEDILACPDFNDWAYDNHFSKLYIHGAPQCGKTTFSAAVADKLLSADDGKGTVSVASVFLDPDDYFVNDFLIAGGGSVPLRQTFLQTVVQQVSEAYTKLHPQTETIDALRSKIKLGCTSSSKTYIIVDGLDRCPAESRHELEDEIANLVDCGCYVMITNYLGLPMDDITEYTCEKCNWDHLSHYWNCRTCGLKICDRCTEELGCVKLHHDTRRLEEAAIELAPNDEEMCMFIGHELRLRLEQGDFDADLHEHLEPQLERVERSICDSSRGVLVICKALLSYLRDFQWAGYEEIMQVQTRVLRPEEETFNVLLSKVKSQDPVSVTTALTAFSLVSQVLPGSVMTFKELADALSHLKVERAINKQDLYALCQGMLVIDGDGTVRPFHDDFSIHLQENCVEDFRSLRIDLADIAIEMLRSLPCHGVFTADTDRALRDVLSKRPFLGYAAPNWGRHLRQSAAYLKLKDGQRPPAGSVIEHAVDLMRSPRKLAACLYLANIEDPWFDLWPGCQALHVCAWFGLTKFISYFTSDIQSPINATDPVYGRTPLMIAASRGHTEFIQRMIDLGADVTFTCEDGRSALLEAVEHDAEQQGYYDTTKAILEHMPKFKIKGYARATTPLIACISKRHGELFSSQLLSLLLDHPSTDVNESTLEGHTALTEAIGVRCSDAETIDLLLQHRDLRLDLQDRAGKTALHLAVQHPQDSSIAIESLLRCSQCTPAVLNVRDSSGMTAVMLLLRNDCMSREDVIPVLRSMSKAGADLLCTDNNGRGLLHAAAAGEHATAVDFLHREKKLPLDSADSFGWCALHYASRMGVTDTVNRLLELGASSTLCDARGWSPLDIMNCEDPEDDNVQMICSLLKPSHQQQSSAMEPITPLRPAWTFATCELDEFHQHSASATDDFWLPDPKCGNLALHSAVEENNIPLCRLLLKTTDINTVNADGKTALFLAIDKFEGTQQIDCLETIKFLLEHGASLQAGVSGLDALEWVRKYGIEQLPLVFIEHGSLPLRYGPDFGNIFHEAAVAANVSVIEKLREARLHPLRRHGSRRLSEIVDVDYISDEIVDLVTSMEHAALEGIWPPVDS